ncbi:hypothetical protein BGX26_005623, partial [Mortierella sp. AD094]
MSRPASPTQPDQSQQTMPPPPPPVPTASTSSTVDSDETDLDESYRDANAIEELQALGSSYANCAATVLHRYKEVTDNMTKIETLQIKNAENKDFQSRQYDAIYNRLAKQEEVLRKQLASLYPTRNPHIGGLPNTSNDPRSEKSSSVRLIKQHPRVMSNIRRGPLQSR